jgi:hypothetical protein
VLGEERLSIVSDFVRGSSRPPAGAFHARQDNDVVVALRVSRIIADLFFRHRHAAQVLTFANECNDFSYMLTAPLIILHFLFLPRDRRRASPEERSTDYRVIKDIGLAQHGGHSALPRRGFL